MRVVGIVNQQIELVMDRLTLELKMRGPRALALFESSSSYVSVGGTGLEGLGIEGDCEGTERKAQVHFAHQ